ncbi:MAG: restriction endonuclease subunit S [Rhodoferax sp.]|uniref:restriction endonuclease subunit S n=1 Tax=Rhodoferax sp. TaxID=50421 RepID=UPI0013FF9AFC|nr:restriction endonuclease subunit S [Rhodoferax sp.]NDP39489.1 restriction endonuclease subunit S [Rhodoferax sp.]
MSYPLQPLSSLGVIQTGSTPLTSKNEYWGGDIPFVTPGDLDQILPVETTPRTLSDEGAQQSRMLQKGSVMVCCIGSLGKIGIAGRTVVTNQQINSVEFDQKKIWPKFGFYACKRLKPQLLTMAPATTIAIVSKSKFGHLEIPVPPLSEQRRIAAILDQADALRVKRREALAQLDSLTQSIFIEMFGDPVINPMKWPIKKFGDVGSLDRGVSKHRPRNAPELLGGAHPLVQTGEIANCDGYVRSHNSSYSEFGLRQSKLWPKGTLCITIAANIAKTGILTFDACFPDSVVGFKAEKPETVEFVRVWLSFLQQALEAAAPESAQKNINLAILRALNIPLPPISLQQAFAERVTSTESLRGTHRVALTELDTLFASLQHRAFRGEL